MGAASDGAGGDGALRVETFGAGAAVADAALADFLAGMTKNISV
jgi:hypothetical protein